MTTLSFDAFMQELLAATPALARQVVARTEAAMKAASTDIALAQDRHLLFQVVEIFQDRRLAWEQSLSAAIQAAITDAHQPAPREPGPKDIQYDELTLVDEAQAEREIDISRTVQLIDLTADWELRELQSLVTALRGDPGATLASSPLRPAVYATALTQASQSLPLQPGERALFQRTAGRALADVLREHYGQLAASLKARDVQPAAYKVTQAPRRARQSGINVSQPGGWHQLMEQAPRVAPFSAGTAQPSTPAVMPPPVSSNAPAGLSLTFQPVGDPGAAPIGASPQADEVLALLQRLFAQMRKDEETPQPVKDLLAQIQPAVLRVARENPQQVASHQHPAWKLFDQVAAQAAGYAQVDLAKLNRFIEFITPRIEQLLPPPGPTPQQFQDTFNAVQGFVDDEGLHQLQSRPQALAELQKADQKLSLQPMLRQQVQHQLEGVRIRDDIRSFLLGPWVDVMADAMSRDGLDGQQGQAMAAVVDDLIHSVRRPRSTAEREALRTSLPGLISRLREGMAHIEMPAEEQDAFLQALMGIHSHHLLAPIKPASAAAASPASPAPADIVRQMREEDDDHTPDTHHVHARPSTLPSTFDTNVGSLPTVPMAYPGDAGNEHPTPALWVQAITPGTWCKVFLQGQWATAKLLWVSDNRQFYMFTSNQAGRTHTLTQRALHRLRAEGLATRLDDRGLTQRAVDGLLQDADEQRKLLH